MQLEEKPDSSPDSLLNEPTNSPLVEPSLDSPPAQEDSKDLLPTNGEVVPFIPQKAPDALKNKSKFGCVVTLFLVLGIGSVLALPSLMSCGTFKGKQAEAKQNIGSMNRSQQAYFLENDTFTNSVETLGIGILTQTVNYDYSIRATKTAAFHYAIARKGKKDIKSYVGGVFAVPATNVDPKAHKDEMTPVGIVCEALRPGSTTPTAPTLVKGVPTCGSDTKDLTRK